MHAASPQLLLFHSRYTRCQTKQTHWTIIILTFIINVKKIIIRFYFILYWCAILLMCTYGIRCAGSRNSARFTWSTIILWFLGMVEAMGFQTGYGKPWQWNCTNAVYPISVWNKPLRKFIDTIIPVRFHFLLIVSQLLRNVNKKLI